MKDSTKILNEEEKEKGRSSAELFNILDEKFSPLHNEAISLLQY